MSQQSRHSFAGSSASDFTRLWSRVSFGSFMGRISFEAHSGCSCNSLPIVVGPAGPLPPCQLETPPSNWRPPALPGGHLNFLAHEHSQHGLLLHQGNKESFQSVCYQESLIQCNVITGVTFHQLCWFIWLEAVTGPIHTKEDEITQMYEHQEEDWGASELFIRWPACHSDRKYKDPLIQEI